MKKYLLVIEPTHTALSPTLRTCRDVFRRAARAMKLRKTCVRRSPFISMACAKKAKKCRNTVLFRLGRAPGIDEFPSCLTRENNSPIQAWGE